MSEQQAEERARKIMTPSLNDLGDYFAVYGTLRNGEYNYNRIIKPLEGNGLEFDGTHVATGFVMYTLGSYPFVVRTNKPSDTIVVELYKITNPLAKKHIHLMEIGAGYEMDGIVVNEKVYGIYVFPNEEKYSNYGIKVVQGGDWVKRTVW